MTSQLSNLGELFAAIHARASEISSSDNRKSLSTLLILSIEDTMDEIRKGANHEEFQDLTILNLMFLGVAESYTVDELKEFIMSLKNENK